MEIYNNDLILANTFESFCQITGGVVFLFFRWNILRFSFIVLLFIFVTLLISSVEYINQYAKGYNDN